MIDIYDLDYIIIAGIIVIVVSIIKKLQYKKEYKMKQKMLIIAAMASISAFAIIAFWGCINYFFNTPSSVEDHGCFTFTASEYRHYTDEHLFGSDTDYVQLVYVAVISEYDRETYVERVDTLDIAERAVQEMQTKELKKFIDSTNRIKYVPPSVSEKEYIHTERKWVRIWVAVEITLLVSIIFLEALIVKRIRTNRSA